MLVDQFEQQIRPIITTRIWEGSKSVWMVPGEQFAVIFGKMKMQVLYANNLGIQSMVKQSCNYFNSVMHAVRISFIGAIADKESRYTETVWPFHIIDLNCTATESTVWECPHNNLTDVYTCDSLNDASIICQGL